MASEINTVLRRVQVVRLDDGYWITMSHVPGCDDVGPYPTKREALDDKAGLIRTIRANADDFFGHGAAERHGPTTERPKLVQKGVVLSEPERSASPDSSPISDRSSRLSLFRPERWGLRGLWSGIGREPGRLRPGP